jgi:hypothetical protein
VWFWEYNLEASNETGQQRKLFSKTVDDLPISIQ